MLCSFCFWFQRRFIQGLQRPSCLKPYIEKSDEQLAVQNQCFFIASIPATNNFLYILDILIILQEVLEQTDNDNTIRSLVTAMLPHMEEVNIEPVHPDERFYCPGCRMAFVTNKEIWPLFHSLIHNKYCDALAHASRVDKSQKVSVGQQLVAEFWLYRGGAFKWESISTPRLVQT